MYKFKEGSWGGANQFLKALKDEFKKRDRYAENSEDADVVLFNSYPFGSEFFFDQVRDLKKKYPEKIILHRLTGPIAMYRKDDTVIDRIIKLFNESFVDGIIFQSKWCMEQSRNQWNITSAYNTVLLNASSKKIFNRKNKRAFSHYGKIKLVASSWSDNWGKGFDIFQYLDEYLDFSKYEMTFIGNSPIHLKNIKHIPPVSSEDLVGLLKESDIFIFGSRIEACSNSLIEALSCGLPAVVPNSSSNPELIGSGGEFFEGTNDVLDKIEKIANSYKEYQNALPQFKIKKVSNKYYEFARTIYDDIQKNEYNTKQITFNAQINYYKIKALVLGWKIQKKWSLLRDFLNVKNYEN
ncbi:MAG: glycosyltransferase family 4 protein [Flavobacteriaceae bacterium]|nr:glycosyltransferase family 4 protein [Flavobacteriaceae bacterium]